MRIAWISTQGSGQFSQLWLVPNKSISVCKVQILVSIPCTILSIQSTILYILFYLIMAITVTDQRNLIYEYVQKFVTNDYDAKNFLRRVWEYEEWNDDDLQEQVRLRIQQAKDTHIQCTLDIIFAYTMDNMSYLRSMLSSEQEQIDIHESLYGKRMS